MTAIGWTGFNLLPYRSGERRRARLRALAIVAGASLVGCAAVGAVAAWDGVQRARLDERRHAAEVALRQLREPVSEHGRFVDAHAQSQRAQNEAAPLAEPRARFLDLLDKLAQVSSKGAVGLQRVTQRAHEVELAATAPDSHAAATWLKSLESTRGVRGVEIVEMRRQVVVQTSSKGGKPKPVDKPTAYDFIAVVRWSQPLVSKMESGAAKARPVARSTR